MRLSIIIPVYNTAPYLSACLSSVCVLPKAQVQIICVNDGSTDQSDAVLKDFVIRYPHLIYLRHEQNQGLSAARNTGLDRADGEYILFLDSDDVLDNAAVLPLLHQAIEHDLDILQTAFTRFDDATGRPLPVPPMPAPTGVLSGDACLARLCADGTFEPLTVIRLYRRAFLLAHGLRMTEGFLFEDELFTAPVFLLAQRVMITDTPLYHYRQREGSIMRGFQKSSAWCEHQLKICRILTELTSAPPMTPGKAALKNRTAAIALSIAKNIDAYGLTGDVRQQALRFVRAHRGEICLYAALSASHSLHGQGWLLRVSLPAFLAFYHLLAPRTKKESPCEKA